jgi:hypothetical protein
MLFFNLEVPKGKPTKSIWIMTPSKTFKKYAFETKKFKNKQKLQFIWTSENMVKFEPFKSP